MDSPLFTTKDQVEHVWNTILRLTNQGEDIQITVPHDRCYHRFDGKLYQIRVWAPGTTPSSLGNGHVSGNTDYHLLETFTSSHLSEPRSSGLGGWHEQLFDLGINLYGGGNWIKETITAHDGSKYDVIRKEEAETPVK